LFENLILFRNVTAQHLVCLHHCNANRISCRQSHENMAEPWKAALNCGDNE